MEKPTMKQRFASFGKFIYNSETHQVLGRSGRSWAEIGIFYVIYYACLAGFFAATLAVFNQTLDDDKPKLMGSDSLLKSNPGMGFQPMPDIETTLIRSTRDEREDYVKSIDKVLKKFNDSESRENCDSVGSFREGEETACAVDLAELTKKCNRENGYGMMTDEPCVLLKLNKIYGWKPDFYSEDEIKDLKDVSQYVKDNYNQEQIWIDCQGENSADVDNLEKATVEYYPQRGFPVAFYPYTKQKNYLSPLVFVKFRNLKKHLGYMIQCKALAKNIAVDRTEKKGSVNFELLID
ncbi:sodium/potassium-transporting ATPase subunit beta-2-like Protein [Elysia marginata]|uniref:Sodium/potassium-transporting ATPase subunit beta-2-like Protein n=1 Tax=Elysia marginata TaxID=1093978 RepID=A0AAV4F1U4_9GAST|nr:sodium/potassium-transporting ATPase subunit beta-2-like Protein [Elysia marginata]